MDNKNNETRIYSLPLEIEKRDGEETRTIAGYGVVFEKWSRDLGWFREKVDKRAFDDVDLTDVVATVNHDFNQVMARTTADTLTLKVDKKGVKYSFDAPNTTAGNDLLENVRNGNVSGSSFMFTVAQQEWKYIDDDPDKLDERTILKVGELIELGPVTMPAYPDTTAAKRSYDESKPPETNETSDERTRTLNINIDIG